MCYVFFVAGYLFPTVINQCVVTHHTFTFHKQCYRQNALQKEHILLALWHAEKICGHVYVIVIKELIIFHERNHISLTINIFT